MRFVSLCCAVFHPHCSLLISHCYHYYYAINIIINTTYIYTTYIIHTNIIYTHAVLLPSGTHAKVDPERSWLP